MRRVRHSAEVLNNPEIGSAVKPLVPVTNGSSQPDISWIKKNVPVLDVGHALGLSIRNRWARCWRPKNHAHGDAHPSLHFYDRRNRVRCFVCDMRGGHSCIDLVMGVLGIGVGPAVRWIAERFVVPNTKPGRPLGHGAVEPAPYRVGVHGSEIEFLVRSGMFGHLSSAESRILVTLAIFRDPNSGSTTMSYLAIMRYSGVASKKDVSRALKRLQKLHAIQKSSGARIGITRKCSTYRATLDHPKFYDLCNETYMNGREQIAQERAYRLELRAEREKKARDTRQEKDKCPQIVKEAVRIRASKPDVILNTTKAGGLCPPDHPVSPVSRPRSNPEERTVTCEGLNLSSPAEFNLNKSVPNGNRESGVSDDLSDSGIRARIAEQIAKLNEYLGANGMPTL